MAAREYLLAPTLQHASKDTHHKILSFWHKVEFFIPYDLQRQVLEAKDAEWSVRLFSAEHLRQISTQALWSVPVPEGRRLCGFDVYLGVFDKAELADVTQFVHAARTAPAFRSITTEVPQPRSLARQPGSRDEPDAAPRQASTADCINLQPLLDTFADD